MFVPSRARLLIACAAAFVLVGSAVAASEEKRSVVGASDVLTRADVDVKAPELLPGALLETTPNYQPVDPDMTVERFSSDVDAISSAPFSWRWNESFGEPDRAQSDDQTRSLPSGAQPGRSGVVSPSAALTSGSRISVMGTPNAATLVLSEIMASKTINGRLYQAFCQYEIWTGTPRATRTIEIGMSWYCNQSWLRGGISVAGAGTNRPDGTIAESSLQRPDGSYVNTFTNVGDQVNRTYAYSVLYDRTFELQLEHLYGFLNLYVDNPQGQDGIFGQPSVAGAYSSYSCNQANKPTVICEFITDPFAFIPTENTQCTNGDVCASLADVLSDPIARTDPATIYRQIIGDRDDPVLTQLATAQDLAIDALPEVNLAAKEIVAPAAEEQIWQLYAQEMDAADAAFAQGARIVSSNELSFAPDGLLRVQPGQRAIYDLDGFNMNAAEKKWCSASASRLYRCYQIRRTADYAIKAAETWFPESQPIDGSRGNAHQHCTWIGVLAYRWKNGDEARQAGERHEDKPRDAGDSIREYRMHKAMDIHNNNEGIYRASLIGPPTIPPDPRFHGYVEVSNACRAQAKAGGALWMWKPKRIKNFDVDGGGGT